MVNASKGVLTDLVNGSRPSPSESKTELTLWISQKFENQRGVEVQLRL